MQLLPGDRVLIALQGEIEIHDIASIETTTSIPSVNLPLWPEYPSLICALEIESVLEIGFPNHIFAEKRTR